MGTVGENLRHWRSKRGMSQDGLERASGVTQGQISAIENGQEGAGKKTLGRLATALRCSISQLDESLASVTAPISIDPEIVMVPTYSLSGDLLGLLPFAGEADFCLIPETDPRLAPELPSISAGVFALTTDDLPCGTVVVSGPAPFLLGRFGISIAAMPKRKLYKLVGFFHAEGDPKKILVPPVTN
jgi:transcriptional regulator with XRE-family HTH domain